MIFFWTLLQSVSESCSSIPGDIQEYTINKNNTNKNNIDTNKNNTNINKNNIDINKNNSKIQRICNCNNEKCYD